MNICRSKTQLEDQMAVEKCYISTRWGYYHSHSTNSVYYFLNIPQFIAKIVGETGYKLHWSPRWYFWFDVHPSHITFRFKGCSAKLLGSIINTSYLFSPYYMFYFIFVFLPDSAPSLYPLSLSSPLSLPFFLPPPPSLLWFASPNFISAAQPSNLSCYDDTAVDSM